MKSLISTYDGTSSFEDRSSNALLIAADELATLPALSFAEHGVEGTKGTLSIIDRGFILHAYFVRDHIDYEVYGPFVPGTEQSAQAGGADDGLVGLMSVDCLKEVIRMLDQRLSPIDHIRSNALEAHPANND